LWSNHGQLGSSPRKPTQQSLDPLVRVNTPLWSKLGQTPSQKLVKIQCPRPSCGTFAALICSSKPLWPFTKVEDQCINYNFRFWRFLGTFQNFGGTAGQTGLLGTGTVLQHFDVHDVAPAGARVFRATVRGPDAETSRRPRVREGKSWPHRSSPLDGLPRAPAPGLTSASCRAGPPASAVATSGPPSPRARSFLTTDGNPCSLTMTIKGCCPLPPGAHTSVAQPLSPTWRARPSASSRRQPTPLAAPLAPTRACTTTYCPGRACRSLDV
jgi:hypothetical protein